MKNEFTVIIDAAHGGKDPGENYNNFHEKDYCLYIANYLVNMFNNEKIIIKHMLFYIFIVDTKMKI